MISDETLATNSCRSQIAPTRDPALGFHVSVVGWLYVVEPLLDDAIEITSSFTDVAKN